MFRVALTNVYIKGILAYAANRLIKSIYNSQEHKDRKEGMRELRIPKRTAFTIFLTGNATRQF
jgi:hypothetical protein